MTDSSTSPTKNGLSLEDTLRRASIERLFRVGTNLDREAALPEPIGRPL